MTTIAGLRSAPAGFDPEPITVRGFVDRRWPVTALALDVSGRCNMACRYCAEAASQPAKRPSMRWQTVEAALAFLADNTPPGVAPTLRLGSGEPLLALTTLRSLDERLKRDREAGRVAPEVYLTTNGTRVDERIADWLAQTGWHVKVSLDGPRFVHDRWRVSPSGAGTWKRVSRAVALLSERIPERLSVTAVLCRAGSPQQVYEAIESLGVRRIELVPAASTDPDILPTEEDVSEYAAFVSQRVDAMLADPDRPLASHLVRFAGIVRRTMGYDNKRTVCGAGRNFYGIDAVGAMFPCFRFVGMADYRLGSLATGPDPGLCANYRSGPGRPLERRESCRHCWAAMLCGGPCFSVSECFGRDDGEPVSIHCAYTLADAHAAVRLTHRLKSLNPSALLQFLPPLDM